MVLAASAEGLVILREDGVAKGRPGGGQPDGPPEVRRASLGDFLPGAGEFPGLGDPYIQPREGDQFARRIKAVDIPDLPQDNGPQGVPNAGNGSDMTYTSLDQLPITLRADELAAVLGISRAGAYTLMRSKGFPTIFIGKRMMVYRDKFIQWMDEQVSA